MVSSQHGLFIINSFLFIAWKIRLFNNVWWRAFSSCFGNDNNINSNLLTTCRSCRNKSSWFNSQKMLSSCLKHQKGYNKSAVQVCYVNFFLKLVIEIRLMYYEIFNPFAPGDFAKKRVLKLVEWFSGHCCAIKS